jgi:hypothetical protein
MGNRGISVGDFMGRERHWKYAENLRGIAGIFEVMDD